MKVLDIGVGRLPHQDANMFMDIEGELLKDLQGEKIVWDLNKVPYPIESESVDKIYFQSVLEHLEIDSYTIIKELRRILKPYGTLEFVVPNFYFLAKRILFLFGTIHSTFFKSHRKYLPYNLIRSVFHDVGFKVSKEKYCYLPFKNLLAPSISMTLTRTDT